LSDDIIVSETVGPTVTGTFTVSRTGPTTDPLTVTYAVSGTGAVNGVNYVAKKKE
jgi:hypothetical protein